MAKDFIFRTDGNRCLDICSYKSVSTDVSPTKIGSITCSSECKHFVKFSFSKKTITCPKIMFRHYTGIVVMRKSK